ncbi:MAG: carbamoyl-phosphate synthase large subunit [Aquificaceae bacterium]|nr:carbamoyl-phosphate synthase large subunit [Aquificaceae bacterium]
MEGLKRVLVIGSGPILIGQAAEFDYSGAQACRELMSEGIEVILVNSNPATIMTDPKMATRTYIEPLTLEVLQKIIEIERPQALLPTMGGQTALNLAIELYESKVLERFNVRLIGASYLAIKKGEDRELFKKAVKEAGLEVPPSVVVSSINEGLEAAKEIGFPVIIRPAFTLGGFGGSVAKNERELILGLENALRSSPIGQAIIDMSLYGWKEIELELLRDRKGNVIVVCGIENLDPMGVHTGDSITVAPIMTLSDKEYQSLRDAGIAIMHSVGIEGGGANVQFAIDPRSGRFFVIEMNPRVSRSSALASKATGFPIAKVATKLALGYTLDEIKNAVTGTTPASFEPSLDYVVVKIPRFDFAKFPMSKNSLGTSMKSVGEVMAIGRTFKQALNKAIQSLELGRYGLSAPDYSALSDEEIESSLRMPNPERLWFIASAFRKGFDIQRVYDLTYIDPWFLEQIRQLVASESELAKGLNEDRLISAKMDGRSDEEIASLCKVSVKDVAKLKNLAKLRPSFKSVDTCAGEFEAMTPYYYSSYELQYIDEFGSKVLDED